MKPLLKRLKFVLQHVDGLWSVPLTFFMFLFVGVLFNAVFGFAAGTYDPGFIQPLFLASTVVIGATNIAVWGVYFTFRGLYRYLYGQKTAEGKLVNYSKKDWIKLTVWQRYLIAFGVFVYFVTLIIVVYLQFV